MNKFLYSPFTALYAITSLSSPSLKGVKDGGVGDHLHKKDLDPFPDVRGVGTTISADRSATK